MDSTKEISPSSEVERVEVLRKYEILDTPPDGSFDRITKLAAELLEVPIAIVSLVDSDRIWFKSRYGLEDVQQISRDPGLCSSAILSEDIYLVEDARKDPRTLSNPLVASEFGLRFYMAVPLETREGYNLGTLCVIDRKPRKISAAKKEILKSLAGLVMNQIELRLEARTAVRHQHQILRTTAHDLKNPLSIMPLLADMIMQNKNNPEAIDDISNQIKTAGKRMAVTIDNLLESAILEIGQVQLRLERIDLPGLVKGVVESNSMLAKNKKQKLILKIRNECSIFADHAKLSEIIDNLINNSIKYSPPGRKIKVEVDQKNGEAMVKVEDEGLGLSRDDLKNLFRPFVSLSARPTGGEKSAGLGLANVKKFVDAHGGQIHVHSEGKGKGAVFTVKMPLS